MDNKFLPLNQEATLPWLNDIHNLAANLLSKKYGVIPKTYAELDLPTPGGSAAWGQITGTLTDQLDLKSALDAKWGKTELTNLNQLTNGPGYITGITSGMVTTALGYTPYNSTNPAGYISGINSGMVTTALGYTPVNKAGDTMTGQLNVPQLLIGDGTNVERALYFWNSTLAGYLYLAVNGNFGFYDSSNSKIRYFSDPTGNFTVANELRCNGITSTETLWFRGDWKALAYENAANQRMATLYGHPTLGGFVLQGNSLSLSGPELQGNVGNNGQLYWSGSSFRVSGKIYGNNNGAGLGGIYLTTTSGTPSGGAAGDITMVY